MTSLAVLSLVLIQPTQIQLRQVYPEVPVQQLWSVDQDSTLGLYVASGTLGTILVSSDGATWVPKLSGTEGDLRGAAASATQLVVASSSGQLFSSADGDLWSLRQSGAGFLENVAFLGGLFVAVGRSGSIYTSTDGIVWSQRVSDTTENLLAVGYDGSTYAAVGGNGVVTTSPDGLTWTEGVISAPLENMRGIAFGNSIWVAGGDDATLWTSPDAVTWTQRTFSGVSQFIVDVVYDGSVFVAATANGHLHTSADGISWTQTYTAPNTDQLAGLALVGSTVVGVGVSGLIVSTPDSAANVTVVNPAPPGLRDIAFDGTRWVTVGEGGHVATSTNGAVWTAPMSGTTDDFEGVTEGGGLWVAVGDFGTVATSADGVSWSAAQITGFELVDLYDVAYSAGVFVAVGESGNVLSSTDGVMWTPETSQTSELLYGVRVMGGEFYAVGQNGALTRSTDGSSWTLVPTSSSSILRDIASDGSGTSIIAGTQESLLSTDGVAWPPVNVGSNFRRCVEHNGTTWFIAGNNGIISYSDDASVWNNAPTVTQSQINRCRNLDNRMVFVSEAGGTYFEALVRVESVGPVAVAEAGTMDTYEVVLESAPLADVTVDIVTDAQVGTDLAQVSFTTANWFMSQTITVSAIDDLDIEGVHASLVSHTVSSADPRFDGLPVGDIMVSITDDDMASVIITASDGSTGVEEDGATDDYTIVLGRPPGAVVNITVQPDSLTMVNPVSIMFNDTNYDTPVTVTVTAVDDAIDYGSMPTSNITHAAASTDLNYDGITIADVSASVTDNDTAMISLAETAGSTIAVEGGASDTYSLVLQTEPTDDVTIAFAPSGNQLLAIPTSLVFTPANWDTVQSVTVAAVDDNIEEMPVTMDAMTHTVTSSDPAYDGFVLADVTVEVADDDEASIILTETGGSTEVGEGSSVDTYTVALGSQPRASVDIAVLADSQLTATPTTLTFNALNWSIPQTVSLAAVNDTIDEGTHTGTVTHVITTTDPSYGALTVPSVTAAITDDDSLAGPNPIPSGGGCSSAPGTLWGLLVLPVFLRRRR